MSDVVLSRDLKLVIAGLSFEQKGKLLDVLLGDDEKLIDDSMKNIYTYICLQQEKIDKKKKRMKEISVIGNAVRWKKDLGSVPIVSQKDELRKEAKEDINSNLNINIKNNNLENEKVKSRKYHIPCIDEVKEYISKHNFMVDAVEFVDFYESRGWCVGSSEIKNWQATVRMWNRRAVEKNKKSSVIDDADVCEDEKYWHELKEKFWQDDREDNKDQDKELYPGNKTDFF